MLFDMFYGINLIESDGVFHPEFCFVVPEQTICGS